jgi:hypothetical protein
LARFVLGSAIEHGHDAQDFGADIGQAELVVLPFGTRPGDAFGNILRHVTQW